jgi:hypothetical protein
MNRRSEIWRVCALTLPLESREASVGRLQIDSEIRALIRRMSRETRCGEPRRSSANC